MSSFAIGGRQIGGGARCFVIAEAGVNHNGELALAHQLVDAAADAGVDAVKFQTFDPEALASAEAPKAAYQARATGSESQREMLKRLALTESAHVELKKHAEDRGLLFLSTPFETASAALLDRLGVAAFKVPSGELTNHPFLRDLARRGRPLLISTGMSDMEEVDAAVRAVRDAGEIPLALFHCTSSYPAPPETANLRAMETLRRRFGVPIGYSDHTLGATVPLAAVALGAELLEKHLTMSRSLPGPDHAASIEPEELRALVRELRVIESALGDGVKAVQPCERETQMVARKSLFAARDLAAGETLGAADLAARRPGTGISPARMAAVIGRRLKHAVPCDAMLREEDLA
jgi:N-acetylneuraminate synthase/N,N'-diacetyllegionaminate synthase